MKQLPDIVSWPGGRLDFSGGCLVMGILNVTPDSFSDGGRYLDADAAAAHGTAMAGQGAAVIDVGPESTRPGSQPVPADQQIRRAVPVIEKLAKRIDIPISIDTHNPEVAAAALEAGASIINDITALADERMTALAVKYNVPVVLMHMQGTPATMQTAPHYENAAADVFAFLKERAAAAQKAGIPAERIFLDPGIGFGKTTEHNLQILNHLDLLCRLGYRVLVGTSRKRFIGQITGRDRPDQRLFGTAATVALAVQKGVSIVRVHDVEPMVDVVKTAVVVLRA